MMPYLPTTIQGSIIFGLSFRPDAGDWGAWNNTERPSHVPEFVGPSLDSLEEQIMAAYPGRTYKSLGSFLIVDPLLGY